MKFVLHETKVLFFAAFMWLFLETVSCESSAIDCELTFGWKGRKGLLGPGNSGKILGFSLTKY
jgi:hypothetical protein